MLIHFNTYFIILATCFGYVIAIIRPTRTVELALTGIKHLLFASIIKIYLKAVIKYWHLLTAICYEPQGILTFTSFEYMNSCTTYRHNETRKVGDL
jgi:hypothetical protein